MKYYKLKYDGIMVSGYTADLLAIRYIQIDDNDSSKFEMILHNAHQTIMNTDYQSYLEYKTMWKHEEISEREYNLVKLKLL